MEIFCHINELGRPGFSSLRALTLACSRVVLWAPSARYLGELRKKDPLLPNDEEILWYVRNGYVKIMARDWWIENVEPRLRHKWRYARWKDSFDGQILDIWREDQRSGRTGSAARVVKLAPVEAPVTLGQQELSSKDVEALSHAVQGKRGLAGYRRRLGAASGPDDLAHMLLRLAKDHGVAFAASGADRNLGAPHEKILYQTLAEAASGSGAIPLVRNAQLPEAGQLAEALENILYKLVSASSQASTREEAFSRTAELLTKDPNQVDQFRNWVVTADLIAASIGQGHVEEILNEALRKEIGSGVMKNTFLDYLSPTSTIDKVTTIGSIAMAAVGFAIGSPLAPVGISLLALSRGASLLKWASVIPDDYQGPSWPFYLAEGTRSPTRKKRGAMINALRGSA